MKYLGGGSLADRLQAVKEGLGPLPSISEVAYLVHNLAAGLFHAHTSGVVHRDIKPNNIMFDEAGIPYIVDFGVAKVMQATSSLTATGAAIGTPLFMAPEQWMGQEASHAADQYALGIVTYMLLTGRPPFDAPTPFALMHKHLSENPPPLHDYRHIPPDMGHVVLRAIAKRPMERFPSIVAYAQAIQMASKSAPMNATVFFQNVKPRPKPESGGGSSTGSRSGGRTATITAIFQRRNLPLTIGALVTLLIIGILGFLVFQQQTESGTEGRQLSEIEKTGTANFFETAAATLWTVTPSITPSITPSPTTTPTALPAIQSNEIGFQFDMFNNAHPIVAAEVMSADANPVYISLGNASAAKHSYVYLGENSRGEFVSADPRGNTIIFSLRNNGRVFVDSVGYDTTQIRVEANPDVRFIVAGSCMSVEHQTATNTLVAACYDGTCRYSLNGTDYTLISPGQEIRLLANPLQIQSAGDIRAEDAIYYNELANRFNTEFQSGCSNNYIPTPMPTSTPTDIPTSTPNPRRTSTPVRATATFFPDRDGDGIADSLDNCPNYPNSNQRDTDGDGFGDACDNTPNGNDDDGDGVSNVNDKCPSLNGKGRADGCPDTDGDGTIDPNDLCPADPNKIAPGQCGCGNADTDSDGDGTANCNDQCSSDPNKIAPGVCGCGLPDTDSDGDGTANCNDLCPADPNKTTPGTCGCGTADTDSDGDGTPNCNDQCSSDPNKTTPGTCGCGTLDTDNDGDGTPNCNDLCPADPLKTAPGACGCGTPDTDSDGDGTPDCNDLCPADPLKTAPGACGCGVLEGSC